jgi:hypothetical protein
MVSFIKDHDFVNEFLFAPPTPATYTERSFPGDTLWLVRRLNFEMDRTFCPPASAGYSFRPIRSDAPTLPENMRLNNPISQKPHFLKKRGLMNAGRRRGIQVPKRLLVQGRGMLLSGVLAWQRRGSRPLARSMYANAKSSCLPRESMDTGSLPLLRPQPCRSSHDQQTPPQERRREKQREGKKEAGGDRDRDRDSLAGTHTRRH